MKNISSLVLLLITAASHAQSTSDPGRTLYINAFRAPSTGLEIRSGQWSAHAGIYTTILGSGEKSTEFIKLGATYYYSLLPGERFKRFESYLSVAYVRGQNRNYEKKDGGFLESGFLYRMGRGFEFRLGTGLLVANGRRAEVNPTVGISYAIPIR